MRKPYHRSILLGLSAIAILTAPVLVNGSIPSLDISAYAGNGHGNGGGGDGGGGDGGGGSGNNGNGGGGGGNSDHGNGGGGGENSDHGNGGGKHSDSASSGLTFDGGNSGHGKKSRETLASTEDGEDSAGHKHGNLNSELAGLNSLKRNINGLMNSNDPRMGNIREFIVASAELEGAKEGLAAAAEALNDARLDYLALTNDLELSGNVTPAALDIRLDEIADLLANPPEDLTAEDITALEDEQSRINQALDSEELANLLARQGDVDDLEAKVAGLEDATDDESRRDAIESAANRNREVTDPVFTWASARIDDLVGDYLASH